MTSTLSPAAVMDLRTSISYRGSSDSTNPLGAPFIVYGSADDTFYLHAYGGCQAACVDPTVLAACLRAERAEPGFIRRILSPDTPCTEAALLPSERAALTAQRTLEASRARAYRESLETTSARRTSQLNLTRIGLDDL